MNASQIILIGYRGTGKTTIAQLLAEKLNWSWVDADVELEKKAGCTIKEIFANQGESHFRDLETEVLKELMSQKDCVIATGGGVILKPVNREELAKADAIIWLTASVETIVKRIETDPTTGERRPNLTAAGGEQEVRTILEERLPIYEECASLIIPTDDLHPEEIAKEILAKLQDSQLLNSTETES